MAEVRLIYHGSRFKSKLYPFAQNSKLRYFKKKIVKYEEDVLCWGHSMNRVIPNKALFLHHLYD